MDEREERNRHAAEHVARLRKAIEDGKAEIDRQIRLVKENREYLSDPHPQRGEAA